MQEHTTWKQEHYQVCGIPGVEVIGGEVYIAGIKVFWLQFCRQMQGNLEAQQETSYVMF